MEHTSKQETDCPCECCKDAPEIDRRALVTGATALAVGASVFGPGAVSAGESPAEMFVQEGDRIQLVKGAMKGELLKPDLLEIGDKQIEAFPYDGQTDVPRRDNRLNRIMVIRLDPEEMDEETRERSVDGVLAYSAVCTHRGCTIKSWKPEERYLRCHCHLSEFDALSGGSVKNGPAKRALPMVPLGLDEEGYVIAMAGFTTQPGGAKK
jgi:Rieske Fe-S protein